ncbi:MAG: EscU/YscU/HrcU family type III secretion system export apparatus switch protein [Defluviitaleaceae bacterium]|nr:EscU/YscU/HrcU family type III secretion system export apparatus switch protein [Defluviitaleaceae bacterium]
MKKNEEQKNNTKKAVAIKYEPGSGGAPEVTAKGYHGTAERIIELGKENKVHIVEDSNLVNELLKVDIGNHIPEELYHAVAQVLVFIERLDNKYGLKQ